jgi:DNA primase
VAGLIPQLVIDEVLAQTDLVQLIDSYWPLKRQGVNFTACCPFHHEKSPSFNVIPKKQFYYCFGCGASGNAISFLMQHQQLGFVAAVEVLASRLGLTIPKETTHTAVPSKKKSLDAYALLQQVTLYYRQLLQREDQVASAYLAQRGLTKEVIEAFELGYASKGWHHLEEQFKQHANHLLDTGMLIKKEDGKTFDRYRHRLMFPIHDRQGRVIGFGGRALETDQQPKYMNSPETALFHKSRELYGLHQLLQHKDYQGPILVVEGYMDVIAMVQHGLFYAVATLGTATTMHHLQLLAKHTGQVIFCFDGDAAGKKAAWRALENALPMMDGSVELNFMFLPDGEDPDSYVRKHGQQAFLEMMAHAKPFNEFLLQTLTSSLALETMAGKSQLINEAISFLNQMPDSAYKDLLIDQLSRLSRLDKERIRQWMRGDKKIPVKETPVNIARSPLRLAIALLLQHPERMLEKISTQSLEAEDEPGVEVLNGLIAYLKRTPTATTAMLVEQWRETVWFESLQKLSTWAHQVPEASIDQEFVELMTYLNRQAFEKKIQDYLSRSRMQGLSIEERAHLQILLRKRHQLV